jgi:hypothetical protein
VEPPKVHRDNIYIEVSSVAGGGGGAAITTGAKVGSAVICEGDRTGALVGFAVVL